ncbi:MAG: hypothetical protein ACP5N7_01260 [Candidatus Pacearchaeota archaeon]
MGKIDIQKYINKIIEVGTKESCTKEETDSIVTSFIGSYNPQPHYVISEITDEFIGFAVRQGWFNVDDVLKRQNITKEDYISFIKGCHLFENCYSGFGSVSQTYTLIKNLIEFNPSEGKDLYNWVTKRGGNYYMPEGSTYEERLDQQRIHAEMRRQHEKDMEELHKAAVERKKRNEESHSKISKETKELYEEFKEKYQKMDSNELVEVFNKDVKSTGWTGSRARQVAALKEIMLEKGIDISAINKKYGLSFDNKVSLIDNKIVVDE